MLNCNVLPFITLGLINTPKHTQKQEAYKHRISIYIYSMKHVQDTQVWNRVDKLRFLYLALPLQWYGLSPRMLYQPELETSSSPKVNARNTIYLTKHSFCLCWHSICCCYTHQVITSVSRRYVTQLYGKETEKEAFKEFTDSKNSRLILWATYWKLVLWWHLTTVLLRD